MILGQITSDHNIYIYSIKPTKGHIEVFKKEKRIYVHSLHDVAIAMFLLTMLEPRRGQKSSEVFKSKSGKNTIHFYCSLTLFTFHDTIHSEILPI